MSKARILLLGLLFCCCGCSPVSNQGSVKANRKDGEVTSIDVHFPAASSVRTVRNRQEADTLINHLEGLLRDIKRARDDMPE